jgi:hypothetical protein
MLLKSAMSLIISSPGANGKRLLREVIFTVEKCLQLQSYLLTHEAAS